VTQNIVLQGLSVGETLVTQGYGGLPSTVPFSGIAPAALKQKIKPKPSIFPIELIQLLIEYLKAKLGE